jgi:hypothetical protein
MEVSLRGTLARGLLSCFLVLGGFAYGQVPPSRPMAANNAASEPMSSNAVRANGPTTSEKGSAHPPVDLPPLPAGEATLLGGTIVSVDSVRDRLIFQAFGGGRSSVLFDERTRVFRDGRRGSLDELRKGERAYVDTVLDGTDVFARNIRLAGTATGESTGQVLGVEPGSGELTLRDPLSPEPVTMRLNADTAIIRGNQKATVADLRPGTLVALSFAGGGDVPTVRQISILAAPGAAFVFSASRTLGVTGSPR